MIKKFARRSPDKGTIRKLAPKEADKLHLRVSLSGCQDIQDLWGKSGACALQVLMLICSASLLAERTKKWQGSKWVVFGLEEMAVRLGVHVNTVRTSIARLLCVRKKPRRPGLIIRGNKTSGKYCYRVQESAFGERRVSPEFRDRGNYGRPAFGKLKIPLAILVKDRFVNEDKYPGALKVLLWFICETTATGQLGNANWLEAKQKILATTIRTKVSAISSGMSTLRKYGIIEKENIGWRYRIRNEFYQCGGANRDT